MKIHMMRRFGGESGQGLAKAAGKAPPHLACVAFRYLRSLNPFGSQD
jgi:hypothetical protein